MEPPTGIRISRSDPGGDDWLSPTALASAGPEALANADYVVVESEDGNLREILGRIQKLDPGVQKIVLPPPEGKSEVERTLLFTPGVGEVWVVEAEDLNPALLRQAADVSKQRRRYRRTRERVQLDLAKLESTSVERARVSDAFLAALLGVVPDPILSLDVEGRIVSANEAASRLIGRDAADLEGRPLPEVMAVPDRPALELLLKEGAKGEVTAELVFVRADGASGVAEVTVAPVRAAPHEVLCVVMHDVTDERRIRSELEQQTEILEEQAAELEEQAVEYEAVNEELRERTDELQRAMETRSRFYAAMSHELRTPLNAIIGYNGLLLDGIYGELPAEFIPSLERSQRAAHHLLDLVNDVLDLAKIEAGHIELQPEEIRLPELLDELADTVRPMATKHGVPLEVQGSGQHTFTSDPRRVRQILLNLLSNAINYGEGNPVRVEWRVVGDEWVEVAIIDRGRGISAEHLQKIFEEFVQVEEESAGTGLGLTISQRLAAALGGALEAESVVGEGSTFRLLLPPRSPGAPTD